jgi:hypothetical protein
LLRTGYIGAYEEMFAQHTVHRLLICLTSAMSLTLAFVSKTVFFFYFLQIFTGIPLATARFATFIVRWHGGESFPEDWRMGEHFNYFNGRPRNRIRHGKQ